jgi:phosphoribosylanthranilate isomerase
MKRLKLKVCGMRDPQNILEVVALNPDYMGFIFYPGSRRFVGKDFSLPTGIPDGKKKVGVFVNEPVASIQGIAEFCGLDLVQLHGDESAAVCEEIRRSGLGVIKAFSIDAEFDFKDVGPYRKAADYFLFDSKGKYFGGNGVAFDWGRLQEYDQSVPFFLSGGISTGDLDAIKDLKAMNLLAIDVNSKVEKSVGIKDVELIKKFGQALHH